MAWMVKTPALKILELRPWEFQNLLPGGSRSHLSSGISESRSPQPWRPPPHMQVIFLEVLGSPHFHLPTPLQVSLEHNMGQDGPEEGPLLGSPGQCPTPLCASVSPSGQDTQCPHVPPPSSFTNSDHL